MLKVECESCKAPYQVDERRVPPTGLKMRCPKCGHTFLVTDPSKGAAPAAGEAPPKAPPKHPTMVGVGAFGQGAGLPRPPAPAPAPAPPPAYDDAAALPAVRPSVPRAAAPRVAPAPPPPAAAPPQMQMGALDDLDLPALPDDIGLPAPAPKAARPATKAIGFGMAPPVAAAAAPAPAPPVARPATHAGGFGGDFGLDLPASRGASPLADLPAVPAAKAPAPAPGGFGQFDFGADLPSLVPPTKGAPPPRGGAPSFGGADLPMTRGAGGGFGDVDLPSPRDGFADLPSPQGFADLPSPQGFADLPSPGGFADLPSPGGFADLPSPGGFGDVGFGSIDLPSPAYGLPAVPNNLPLVGGSLPMPRGGGGFGEIDLPSVQNDLPAPLGMNALMPSVAHHDPMAPHHRQGAPATSIAFGELDLPSVGDAPPGGPGADAVSFGELDLPPDPQLGPGPGPGPGMAFGEVDLGGAEHDQIAGPPPAMSAGNLAFSQEASLEAAAPPAEARPKPVKEPSGPTSKAPKIVAAAIVLLVVGGTALQFTPVGAFGYLYISDKMHAADYAKAASTAGDDTRKKLGVDTFAEAQKAADDLAELRRKAPRARPLAAYAAFVVFANQVRFGGDAGKVSHAQTFITDIPAGTNVPYLAAALAAQDAATGDLKKGHEGLVAAAGKEPNDGIQQDISLLRGEIELAMHDGKAAQATYTQALKSSPTARSHFGLARAYYQTKDFAKAKTHADEALKLSPKHVGALTLRATLAWEVNRDDTAALKDLASVLDDKVKRASFGASELSNACAAKGMIMLARDHAGEARAAFDEAVKVDPRNASALVGQGEVLYGDGRFTEALTRFDEAAKKDPSSITALIGGAKTKIALERLADAKSQLTAGRQKAPKDMSIALWLAKAEEALGNKTAAEQLYMSAVDLADPTNLDAIQAYAALASFLASQGRAGEAQTKLDQAKAKLPDSAALQRAFGEVASAQGHFEEAINHYEAALAKNPSDLGTRFRLGVTYRKMRRLEPAAQEFDRIVAVDKEYPGIALERGLLFEESGDVQKALEQFNAAFQKAPNDLDLMMRVGAAYVTIGEVEKALPLLNKVREQRANSAEANHFVGRAYLKQGGLESAAAMRYLKRAVELDANRAEYHLYVAWAANEATPAQLGLARTHVDKALALDKLLADAYWQRGVVERREGAVNDAIKDLRRALELKPSRNEAHASLAECLEDKNDVAGAMAEWSKAIQADDKQPAWRYHYGRLLLDKGNAPEAARHLAYALDNGKSSQPRPGWLGPAAFEAGEAFRKTNQKQPAIDAYNLYLELSGPTAPDRKEALAHLKQLGAPYEGPGR